MDLVSSPSILSCWSELEDLMGLDRQPTDICEGISCDRNSIAPFSPAKTSSELTAKVEKTELK